MLLLRWLGRDLIWWMPYQQPQTLDKETVRTQVALRYALPFSTCSPPPHPLSLGPRYSVYSYGGGGGNAKRTNRGDGGNSTFSRARESIRSCASSFVDLYADSYSDSVERIRADGVDILVDLQGHTLGGRGQITAARPALVQVWHAVAVPRRKQKEHTTPP